MPSTYLSKTGSGSGATTCTFSGWIKRSELQVSSGNPQCIWGWKNGASNADIVVFHFDNNSEDFRVYIKNSADTATEMMLATSREFRDVNGWYHIVIAIDTTQATSSNRAKLYINGVQETSFSTETYPTQNYVLKYMSSTGTTAIGHNGINSYPYSGLLSHIHYIDGTAYDASAFGEFDATTGIWKPKTQPSVTYGTNGFFLKFENSGSMGLDSSGNVNNFTVSGNLTQTVDTPSNVFATLNYLKKLTGTLSNGNTTWSANGDNGVWSTIGVNKGKWYWETQNNSDNVMTGIASENVTQTTDKSSNAGVYGIQNGTTYALYRNNGTTAQSTGFPQPSTSVTVCHALDLDNGKYFLGVDGVYKDLSGTASDVVAGTNPTFSSLDTNLFWFPFIEARATSCSGDINFGNGYFGTTPVTSAGSNGNGAIFEFDVPTGYYALNTKNLATYG